MGSQNICLGFEKTKGKCTNKAGCPHTPYFCKDCNKVRMDHISKKLEDMVQKQLSTRCFRKSEATNVK